MTSKAKNFRRRAEEHDDEDTNGNGSENLVFKPLPSKTQKPSKEKPSSRPARGSHLLSFADDGGITKKDKSKQKQPSSRPPPPRSLLSFDADEDCGAEQGFQRAKKKTGLGVGHGSAHKIAPSKDRGAAPTTPAITSNVQPQAGEYTKEKLLELQKNTKSLGGSKPQPLAESNKPSETVVVLKGLVKPSVEGNELNLDAERLKGETFTAEKVDVEDSLGLKGIDTAGVGIPDQATINAIRAKRERLRKARAAPDYIPLDGARISAHGGELLKDSVDSSDDEVEIHGRLAMLGDKPSDLKKGVFESLERGTGNLSLRGDREHGDEDEDDEDKRWEEEQFRKGFGKRVDDASNRATASQVPAAGVSAPASTSASGSFQVAQTVGYAASAYAAAPPQNWPIAGSRSAEVMSLSQHADVATRALQESLQRLRVVNIWDLRDYHFWATIPMYEPLEAVCVLPSGSRLVSVMKQSQTLSENQKKSGAAPVYFLTVGERGIVRIWYSEGALCLYEQKSSDAIISSDKDDMKGGFVSAVLLPLAQGVLCVTADQRFLFYDLGESDEGKYDLKISKRLIGYNEEIVDLKFLGEEEKFLAVATNLEQVRMYDLASMTCVYELLGHTDIVLCLDTVVLSGHILLASGSKDHTVRIWDTESKSCICVAAGHMGAVGAVAFSKKAKNFFVSGSSDRTIKVWSFAGVLGSGSISKSNKLSSQAAVAAHDKDINSVAVAPNDSLICTGSQDRTARVWRLPDLVPVLVLRGHKRGVWCVEFSPVDQCVMTASGDKTIKIWALSDGSCLKTFEGHTASVLRASFLTRGTQFVSSGADGLLKLWTIKSNECIATFDQHEDKIWALAVGKNTEMLATGGGDSLVNLWHDCTATDEEEALLKEEEAALKDQELLNALADTDYVKAIQLAFELRRPYKLLNVFTELYSKGHAKDQIHKVIRELGKEELGLLLEYVREWNTKPKFSHVAQFVLFQLFNVLPPTEIIEVQGISELLEGVIPYAQRHYSRIERLMRSTFLLDYTLSSMSVLSPAETNLSSSNLLARTADMPNIQIDQFHQTRFLEPKSSPRLSLSDPGNTDSVEVTAPQAKKKRVSANDPEKTFVSEVEIGDMENAFDEPDTAHQGSSKKHKPGSSKKKKSKAPGNESLKDSASENAVTIALQA